MWVAILIIGIILAILIYIIVLQQRTIQQQQQPALPADRELETQFDFPVSPDDPLAPYYPDYPPQPDCSTNGQRCVVGAILSNDMATSSLMAASISYGQSGNINFPVGTILVNSAPENVQMELLTSIPISPLQGIDVPESFDCREKWPGLITQPYHQGTCGSCWAFAAALAVADRFRIAEPDNQELLTEFMYQPFAPNVQYPVMNALSPYELVACDTCGDTLGLPLTVSYQMGAFDTSCDHGCEGGFLQVVYEFLRDEGATTLVASQTCCDPTIQTCPCIETPGARIYQPSRIYSLVSDTESAEIRRRKIMEDVFQRGPVSIGYLVYESFYDYFGRNPTGVYSQLIQPPNDRPIGGHAVDIVGWGTDPETGIFYWTMRNSWGMGWGDGGYFRIAYDFEGILDNVMGAEI